MSAAKALENRYPRAPARPGEEARKDMVYLVQRVAGVIGSKARQRLAERGAWALEHMEALQRLARGGGEPRRQGIRRIGVGYRGRPGGP